MYQEQILIKNIGTKDWDFFYQELANLLQKYCTSFEIIEGKNKSDFERGLVPKIREAIKEIQSKSYLANDVWDDTNGFRKYQNISMPTVELNTVIEVLQKYLSER